MHCNLLSLWLKLTVYTWFCRKPIFFRPIGIILQTLWQYIPDFAESRYLFARLARSFKPYTAMDKWLHTIAILWSKMAFFRRACHIVEGLPLTWASQGHWSLIRPLKWGTQCLQTPSGSKLAGRQSWKYGKQSFRSKESVLQQTF